MKLSKFKTMVELIEGAGLIIVSIKVKEDIFGKLEWDFEMAVKP